MTRFTITRAGLQTLIQDGGRKGYLALGIPMAGVMDKKAAAIANWLVANPRDYPVVEIAMMGPSILIDGPCQIALTGANLSPQIDDIDAPINKTIVLKGQSVLTFGRPLKGCRCYLAIGGEWHISRWLGSYSASPPFNMDLTVESVISKGDSWQVAPPAQYTERTYDVEDLYESSQVIRVLAGPEFQEISRGAIAQFFGDVHQITNDSNRMGYKLNSHLRDFKSTKEIISSGIVPGTVQLTNDGQPIILLADAQTSGGYYRIANVISADLDILAQCRPKDTICFKLVDVSVALKALQMQKDEIDGMFRVKGGVSDHSI